MNHSKLTFKYYDDAKQCAKNISRLGAKNILLKIHEENYQVEFIGTEDLIATARSGTKYSEREVSFILALKIYGYSEISIAKKIIS